MSAASWGRLTDAPATFVLRGARVIDPADGTDVVRDLAVRDGVIVDASSIDDGAERLDAGGLVVAPGFVDLHAHLREPGTDGETIESGARAAARGGFTTICAMPNTQPAVDGPDAVQRVIATAADAACRVRVVTAVSDGRAGERVADLEGAARSGAVAASDDGAWVAAALIRDAMQAVARAGVPLIEHAEDPERSAAGVMRAGATANRLGLRGWPADAETEAIRRDVALATETGARLHLTHVSTSGAVDAVREAKSRGVAVTADVTPHHLALTDHWVAGSRRFAWEDDDPPIATKHGYDGACRVNPPLPSRGDAEALLRGLRDGTIDAIATDHAPHPAERKLVPFAEAAPGMIGLETALSLGLAAVAAGALELVTLLGALGARPGAVIGERRSLGIGETANLVAFDPEARWRVERAALASMSANTPLLGLDLPGVVRLTVAEGRVTYRS